MKKLQSTMLQWNISCLRYIIKLHYYRGDIPSMEQKIIRFEPDIYKTLIERWNFNVSDETEIRLLY